MNDSKNSNTSQENKYSVCMCEEREECTIIIFPTKNIF